MKQQREKIIEAIDALRREKQVLFSSVIADRILEALKEPEDKPQRIEEIGGIEGGPATETINKIIQVVDWLLDNQK